MPCCAETFALLQVGRGPTIEVSRTRTTLAMGLRALPASPTCCIAVGSTPLGAALLRAGTGMPSGVQVRTRHPLLLRPVARPRHMFWGRLSEGAYA